ncbi:MAG: hypothetical protein RMJ15_08960 [Nitrososphaerota archaeon]|nr:hypothetical protein [Nitrososphaerota archaeon]
MFAAILAESMLIAYFVLQSAGYWMLTADVNSRWNMSDPRVFVTPGDPAVRATVNAVVYGELDSVKDEDLRLYLRMLSNWVSVNVKPNRDPPTLSCRATVKKRFHRQRGLAVPKRDSCPEKWRLRGCGNTSPFNDPVLFPQA